MMPNKQIADFILCVAGLGLLGTTYAQSRNALELLPIKLPMPSFTGTPLNYTSQNRGPHIGVCADMGYWMRAGIDPVATVKTIGKRLFVIQMHDLNEMTPEGHDVPWGSGSGRTEAFLKEVHHQGIQPKMFGLEYSYDWSDSMPEVTQSARFFDKVTVELTE